MHRFFPSFASVLNTVRPLNLAVVTIVIIIIIIIIIRNSFSAVMPLGGYRGAGGTGR